MVVLTFHVGALTYFNTLKCSHASLRPGKAGLCTEQSLKAGFHDSENRREKLCLRNTDGCTWVILLNFPTLFAFAVSRMNFYSLAKRTFFSRNLICLHHACVQLFPRENFRISQRKNTRGIRPLRATYKLGLIVYSLYRVSQKKLILYRVYTGCTLNILRY